MTNVFIINAHQYYSFSEGELNRTMAEKAAKLLTEKGHVVRMTTIEAGYDIDEQIAHHQWADRVILQTPVYWMGVPWLFKKYMDDVYTAGVDGRLCHDDGRSSKAPKANYGSGGSLQGKKYMLSLTFNAPKEAFNDPNEYLFQGKSVDDLLFPAHMNFRFFGMTAIETFACHDVKKNPEIASDLARFKQHLDKYF